MVDYSFWSGLLLGIVVSLALFMLLNRKLGDRTLETDLQTRSGVPEGSRNDDEEIEDEDDDEEEEEEEEEDDGENDGQQDGEIPNDGTPYFPFLTVKNNIPDTLPRRVYPNAREPQIIENELVSGKTLVALRVMENEDPHFDHFFQGKNRRFEMQFQLTLKSSPRGIIYLGGEVPSKMQLGVMTKGLCRAILAVLNRLSSKLHAGFGKNISDPEECELPHICFPLFSAATKMVITKAGDAPPQLGVEIEESTEQVKNRVKQGINLAEDLKAGDTITFSINSMYMDIVNWKATNLGALGDMDLSMFWDTMPLHLVMYDVPTFNLRGTKLHSRRIKKEYFSFCIRNTIYKREGDDEPVVIYPKQEGILSAEPIPQAIVLDEEDMEYSPQPSPIRSPSSFSMHSDGSDMSSCDLHILGYCERHGKKKREFSFLFQIKNDPSKKVYVHDRNSSFLRKLVGAHIAQSKNTSKIMDWENLYRTVQSRVQSPADGVSVSIDYLERHNLPLLHARSKEDMGVAISSKYASGIILQCPVLRPLWETYWREEWAALVRVDVAEGGGEVVFVLFYQSHSKQPCSVLCSTDILAIHEQPTSTICYPFVEIELKGRVVLVGFPDAEARRSWVSILRAAMESGTGIDRIETGLDEIVLSSNPTTEALSYETNRWGTQKRHVLNSRRIVFPSSNPLANVHNMNVNKMYDDNIPEHVGGKIVPFRRGPSSSVEDILDQRKRLEDITPIKPWELATILLQAALEMTEESSDEKQIHLFDQASQLREIDIISWSRVMTEEEKLCFALNLYHALRLHAKFLVGQPSSLLGWASFGNRVSYALGAGEHSCVLSLCEIEHCLLRAPSSAARSIIQPSYPHTRITRLLQLTIPEPRLNFCINYGTKTSSSKITVFHNPSVIDRVMDKCASNTLQELVKIKGTSIYLPKIVSWYAKDFLAPNESVTAKALASKIASYCAPDLRRKLLDSKHYVFKISGFKWKCLDNQQELTFDD